MVKSLDTSGQAVLLRRGGGGVGLFVGDALLKIDKAAAAATVEGVVAQLHSVLIRRPEVHDYYLRPQKSPIFVRKSQMIP